MTDLSIRPSTLDDAASLLEIYRPFVVSTAVSFELEPPTVEEFARRIDVALRRFAWLVAEQDRRAVGYAYATPHRSRGAYQWSVETSVYVGEGRRGQSVGTALYRALMPRLAERGYCNAYAGITLPNEASVALHRKLGFQPIGVFPSVGHKFGVWHDVSWWHLRLRAEPLSGSLVEPGHTVEAPPSPSLSYRSPKTVVSESPIHGRGLFARAPIARGEIVAIKGGYVFDDATRRALQETLGPAEIPVADGLFIGPLASPEREGGMIFSNHSCDPNIGVQGQIVFVAMRDIHAGEELTHDWATTDDDSYDMVCRCGTPACRRIITGQDWRRPELQARYRGYMAWHLERKIAGAP